MRHFINIYTFLLLAVFFSNAVKGQDYTLSGRIIDSESGEFLPGATILVKELNLGISSNRYGFYSLTLNKGEYDLEISYVGYESIKKNILLDNDSVIYLRLNPGIEFEELIIKSSGNTEVFSPVSGAHRLSTKVIEEFPAMLGEKDVLKTLQSLPGVKGGNEGTSGMQVRGGSHDQNLILLDGVPVYNTNHLFGYLSTFNSDAIKDVQFYKGSIPARHGGRLSSVVDMAIKEGNMNNNSGCVWLSPVSGSILSEGPVLENKASYLLSFRRTWLDIPFALFQLIRNDGEKLSYSFYDFNGKINWEISPKSQLFLSHYQGKDGYSIREKDTNEDFSYGFNWGNTTTLLRWNYQLSSKLFVNTSAYYSNYRFEETTDQKISPLYSEKIISGIKDLSIKSDVDLSLRKNYVKFGYHFSYQVFNPEITKIQDADIDTVYNIDEIDHVTTLAAYIEDKISLSRNFTIQPGIRTVVYIHEGKNNFHIEPRLSMAYGFANSTSLKLSVQKMTQAVHLLTNTALNMPTDLWVPSTQQIDPEIGWQYDIAYAQKYKDYFFTLDIYYKKILNTIRYKQGISFASQNSDSWEDLVDIGEGLNYGTEIMFEKRNGRITGWMNYTLSWAWRKIDGINNGEYFPFKYDRRHDINILFKYNIKQTAQKQNYFSAAFKFASGNAVTIPTESVSGASLPGMEGLHSAYSGYFQEYQSFPHPNNYRMPAFHHLDIAYSISKILSNGNKRTWKFSIYNVYNRRNPYYFVKRYDQYFQVSLLPIIPSFAYSYSW